MDSIKVPDGAYRSRQWCRVVLLITGLFAITGCGDSTPMGLAEVEVTPGSSWTAIALEKVVVPGKSIAAWSGPENASLVVLSSLPIPDPSAEGLAKETSTRWLNFPGLSIISTTNPSYGGVQASRVEAVGSGFGNTLAPMGTGKPVSPDGKPLIPTRCVSVSFPRGQDTLTLLWHYPASAQATFEPQVEATLKSLKIVNRATSTYSY
jgi:hypothetical protein